MLILKRNNHKTELRRNDIDSPTNSLNLDSVVHNFLFFPNPTYFYVGINERVTGSNPMSIIAKPKIFQTHILYNHRGPRLNPMKLMTSEPKLLSKHG